jgi:hypothetical protein
MTNRYEERLIARAARLEARADKLAAEGHARIDRAKGIASHIPFGQPILVGHHSEGRARRDAERIHTNFDKGFQALSASKAVAAKAAAVGTGGISSDDPDALVKLRAELADVQKRQERMKATNVTIRKHKADPVPALVAMGYSEDKARALIKPDFCGRVGYPDYALTNNSANGRRIAKRIAQLEARAGQVESVTVTAGVRVVENVDDNRLQLFFPDKPSDGVRADLKARGFRWSPTAGAWQRQLNNAARFAAKCVLDRVGN